MHKLTKLLIEIDVLLGMINPGVIRYQQHLTLTFDLETLSSILT